MTITLPPTFTEAHRRALEWLPEDGSFRLQTLDVPSNSLNSLELRGLAGSISSINATRWRLTTSGIALIKKAKGQ